MIAKAADSYGHLRAGITRDALHYATIVGEGADIVNMSLEGPSDGGLRGEIERHVDKILIVAAAGNKGREIAPALMDPTGGAVETTYPAALSAVLRNVISVAAHGPDGRLHPESNYGAQSIDIAAPGVCVPSTTIDGDAVPLSGTSQAAAFVSLTAALLHSLGLQHPPHLRERLLASVDFDPNLAEKLSSGGRLDVPKAISVNRDYIEFRDTDRAPLIGHIFRVTVGGQSTNMKIGDIPLRSLRKLTYDGSTSRWRTAEREREGRLTYAYVAVDEQIELHVRHGGAETRVPIREVADMVPRWF